MIYVLKNKEMPWTSYGEVLWQGIYYFDNEGIAIFYQKEFNKKIVEKIDISLLYEDNLNISDIGKILNIEILKQIL